MVAGASKNLGVLGGDYPIEINGSSCLNVGGPGALKKKIEAAVKDGDTKITFYRLGATQAELDEKYPQPKPPKTVAEEAERNQLLETQSAPVGNRTTAVGSTGDQQQAFSRTQSLMTENTEALDKRGQQIERNAEEAEELAAGTGDFASRAKRIAEIQKSKWWF